MIGLARLFFCGLVLSVCALPALADSVTVTGNVSFDPSLLSFAPPFATQTNTGFFSEFSNGVVNYELGTVQYTLGLPQTVQAFTITAGSNVLAFYDEVNDPTQSFDTQGNLDVRLHETGYYTVNGGAALAGTFDVLFNGNSPFGSTTNVPFLGAGMLSVPAPVISAAAPEPASYLLMGTGFLLMATLLRSKSRRQSE